MSIDVDRQLRRARDAKRESRYLDFKQSFDPANEGEWIELIKDFVALANSGGGVIVIGVANDGTCPGIDVTAVLAIDGAIIGDKLMRFVGQNFDEFEIHEVARGAHKVAALVVGYVTDAPLVFIQPGNYEKANRKQQSAFARGAVYVRHGAKSEPATSADLRAFIDHRLDDIREDWLEGIRRVVNAEPGTEIVAIERAEEEDGLPARIRITTDDDATVYGVLDPGEVYRYRQKELIDEVNARLDGAATINSRDIQAIKAVHGIAPDKTPRYAYKGRFDYAPTYSDEFVDWIVDQFRADEGFFTTSRDRYGRSLHERRG